VAQAEDASVDPGGSPNQIPVSTKLLNLGTVIHRLRQSLLMRADELKAVIAKKIGQQHTPAFDTGVHSLSIRGILSPG
jgi:hypothetical protein